MSQAGVRGFSPSLLRDARARARLTLEALSIRSGVSAAVIGHWETGRSIPSAKLLTAVAATLNLRLADFTTIKTNDMRMVDLRARAGLTQQDVAQHLGVAAGTASALDRGYAPLRPPIADRLAELYAVSTDDLHQAWQRSRDAQ